MDSKAEIPSKKRRSYDEYCLFSNESLTKDTTDNLVVQNPGLDALKTILKAAETRKDIV